MITKPDKNKTRQKRHARVRGKISGTAQRPRLSVFRSNSNIYAQVIDDVAGVTLASASTLEKENQGGTKSEQASKVGQSVAKLAIAKKSLRLFLTGVGISITDVFGLWPTALVKQV